MRFFNGTRDGQNYQARVIANAIYDPMIFEVDIVIFDRTTGEPYYSFTRMVPANGRGQRAAVRAVLKDPEAFV